jgi:hypothetical protein
MLDKLKACTALWGAALIIGVALIIQIAPPSRADGCGDVGGAHVSAGSCTDPTPPTAAAPPQGGTPWIGAFGQRDPHFVDS